MTRKKHKKRIVVCDIDGTVARHEGVRGHYEYSRVSEDRPNRDVIVMVKALAAANGAKVVFVSGREGTPDCHLDTFKWLCDNFYGSFTEEFRMFMRKEGDRRKDDVVKREIHDELLLPNFDIVAVVEDRDRVVKMWRSLGYRTYQVADGNF